MHLTTRNVNTAFTTLVESIYRGDLPLRESEGRTGKVISVDEPVIITYTHPQERVLFNEVRDCNPFFHLVEAMWMLAGRNDVVTLSYFNKRMEQYSDDGKTFNGAYGYRWRNKDVLQSTPVRSVDGYCQGGPLSKRVDQLDSIINHLKSQPYSRRAVLQMWNVEDDLLKIDPSVNCKDVCCNLSVLFSLRESKCETFTELDMTVLNRSNDLIWGTLGANAVHFSYLQEYIALSLGVRVGKYNHITNNLHYYENNWKPDQWLNATLGNLYYHTPVTPLFPLVNRQLTREIFDRDNTSLMDHLTKKYIWDTPKLPNRLDITSKYILDVVLPVVESFILYKQGRYNESLIKAESIKSSDWSIACYNWLQRRITKKGIPNAHKQQ